MTRIHTTNGCITVNAYDWDVQNAYDHAVQYDARWFSVEKRPKDGGVSAGILSVRTDTVIAIEAVGSKGGIVVSDS